MNCCLHLLIGCLILLLYYFQFKIIISGSRGSSLETSAAINRSTKCKSLLQLFQVQNSSQ